MTTSASIPALPDTPACAAVEPGIAHREDHTDLLASFQPGAPRSVDAVVVPVGRKANHLDNAAELALRLACPLVAMCGADRGARPAEVAAVLSEWPDLRWYVLDVPREAVHVALAFGRSGTESRWPLNLLGTKRNIGLLLGRMLGWRAVLLLDDDITNLDCRLVEDAASGLDVHQAVGLTVADWPDNSVVCHANRLGHGAQSVFVSGAALLVDSTRPFGFFPGMYNEDWLFLIEWLRDGAVAAFSCVGQLRYDPYDSPDRSRRQEFGEVIAEGLVARLHRDRCLAGLDEPGYWAVFLERRRLFIADAKQRVADAGSMNDAVYAALDAAEQERAGITPESCAGFIRDLQQQSVRWRQLVERLPTVPDLSRAAAHLGLPVSRSSDTAVLTEMCAGRATPDCPSAPHSCGDLVVVLPGFLDTIDYRSTTELVAALRTRATTVIPLELHGAWSTNDGDGMAAEYRVSRHVVDILRVLDEHSCTCGRRTAVVGFCYGAQLAALCAAMDCRVTDIIALMPTRTFIWAEDYDPAKDRWSTDGVRRFPRDLPKGPLGLRTFAIPYAVVQDALDHDTVAAFRSVRGRRILFVAAEDDEFVPASSVERLYRDCIDDEEGNHSVGYELLVGVQHDYRGNRAQIDTVNRTVMEWLWPGSTGTVGQSSECPPVEHSAAASRPYRLRRGGVRL